MEADPLGSHVRDELGLQPGRLGALALLALLGSVGAQLGGARTGRAALRVTLGGALAMGLTALIGQLVGATGL